jgi:hypothetical protein
LPFDGFQPLNLLFRLTVAPLAVYRLTHCGFIFRDAKVKASHFFDFAALRLGESSD